MDAAMDMGKLATARVRKAIDPKILEVKKRVRQVGGGAEQGGAGRALQAGRRGGWQGRPRWSYGVAA
jgi:hypothetical protein